MILYKAEMLLGDIPAYNKELNVKIKHLAEETHKAIAKADKLHIVCIGNAEVGTTTILNSMIGEAKFDFVVDGLRGELRECEHADKVFIESPGLANTRLRKQAANSIKNALSREGAYQIFFVVTTEA